MSETRSDVREFYSMPGADYDHQRLEQLAGRTLSQYDIDLFRSMLPPPSGTALEVGAGTGRFTIPCVEAGWDVVATDINESLLGELRQKLADHPRGDAVEVRNEDAFALSFDDASFGFAYSMHVIPRFGSLDDQRGVIREIARVLRPGGRVLLNFRNKRSLLGLFHGDFAPSSAEFDRVMAEASLRPVDRSGKWFMARRVLDVLPKPLYGLLQGADRAMLKVAPRFAWDVLLVAEKV